MALRAPRLAGRGIEVRPWVASDAVSLEPACGDPEICRFTTVPWHYTPETAAAWISRQHDRLADGAAIVLAIDPIGGSQPVGMVGLFELDELDRAATFGYWVVQAHRGSGVAARAVRLLADWAFEHLDVDVLHIDVEPANEPSRRVAQAVGASRERRLTRQVDGESVLLERFALLRQPSSVPPGEHSSDAGAAAAYDGIADAYEAAVVQSDRAYNSLYERPAIISMLPDVTGRRVLDVGCGSGSLSAWLADHDAAHIVGFDASASMVHLARQKQIPRATFRVADLSQPLAFLDEGSFDVAVASLVMHYLRDWVEPLRELRRVLKPQGVLVLSTHHPASDIELSATGNYFGTELLHDSWNLNGQTFDVRFWRRPLTDMFAAFEQAGFSVLGFLEPRPLPQCRSQFPDAWEKLTTRPGFAFFKLLAPACGL